MRNTNKATSSKRNAKRETVTNVPAIIDAAASETVTGEISATNESEAHESGALVIDGTTGETIQPETANDESTTTETASEAKPDPRAAKAERIAADRAAVSALYATFERNRLSVPVKPLSAFKLAASSAHPIARNVSQRQCAALAVAFTAAGVQLAAGAQAARVFTLSDKPVAIENGVLRDAISSGLCTVSGETPEAEIITLSKTATASITGQLGAPLLKAAGIIA